MIFNKPGDTIHYILKCDPIVRKLIYKNHDKLKLEWGVYTVRDRYHALICYYCQKYGHMESDCAAKAKGENQICYKCAGMHKGSDCSVSMKKCINCVRYKKSDMNHSVNDHCCPVFLNELQRAKDNTDHGYY